MHIKRNLAFLFLAGICFCVFIFYFKENKNFTASETFKNYNSSVQERNETKQKAPEKSAVTPQTETPKLPMQAQPANHSSIVITANNFEEMVQKCFQGAPCTFGEDPWKLYLEFKRSNHPRVCDSIIALMRKNMQDPDFKAKYQTLLLGMIKDFYSPKEVDFQLAAYYNYLGDLQKSLNLYLDLEKKSAKDPTLRRAPKLNIANTYYDLHRYQEALPYYQAALHNYSTNAEQSADQRSMIDFIQSRIDEIQKKLGN